MPMNLERQSGVRRRVSPLLMFAGIVIGLVAVSRAKDPQDSQKGQVATPSAPGEVEIRNLLKAVTDTYNQADAKGLAARFTDDAELFDQDGEVVRGHDRSADTTPRRSATDRHARSREWSKRSTSVPPTSPRPWAGSNLRTRKALRCPGAVQPDRRPEGGPVAAGRASRSRDRDP